MTTGLPTTIGHKTMAATRFRDGSTRRECWSATTTDGRWRFERTEEPGTPWQVTHQASGALAGFCSSLKWCLAYVNSGRADANLTRGTDLPADQHAAYLAEAS